MNNKYLVDYAPHAFLKGAIIRSITGVEEGSERVRIELIDGGSLTLYHAQDCCETVSLHDFSDDPEDLEGAIINAFEDTQSDAEDSPEVSESGTWTFYKLETSKGGLWMRWLGESNGFYSEEVSTTVEDSNVRLRVSERGMVSAYDVSGLNGMPATIEPLAQMEITDPKTMEYWITAVARLHES